MLETQKIMLVYITLAG